MSVSFGLPPFRASGSKLVLSAIPRKGSEQESNRKYSSEDGNDHARDGGSEWVGLETVGDEAELSPLWRTDPSWRPVGDLVGGGDLGECFGRAGEGDDQLYDEEDPNREKEANPLADHQDKRDDADYNYQQKGDESDENREDEGDDLYPDDEDKGEDPDRNNECARDELDSNDELDNDASGSDDEEESAREEEDKPEHPPTGGKGPMNFEHSTTGGKWARDLWPSHHRRQGNTECCFR
jgi:hypothetical protein